MSRIKINLIDKEVINYELIHHEYNCDNNCFKLEINSKNNYLKVYDDSEFTKINFNSYDIIYFKKDKIKKIFYNMPINELNTPLYVELHYNEKNEKTFFRIGFFPHKFDEKVKGMFSVFMSLKKYFNIIICDVSFNNGVNYHYSSSSLDELDEDYFYTKTNGIITIDLINELIEKFLVFINCGPIHINKKTSDIMPNILTCEDKINEIINIIKEEIPLTFLHNKLDYIFQTSNHKKKQLLK